MTAKEFWEIIQKNHAEDFVLFSRDETGDARYIFEDNLVIDTKRKEIMTYFDIEDTNSYLLTVVATDVPVQESLFCEE